MQVYTKQLKARSWLLYSNLLDFAMMAVSDEAQGIASLSQSAGAVRLGAALRALQQLLKGAALEAGLVQPGVLVELLQLLQASCEEVGSSFMRVVVTLYMCDCNHCCVSA